MAKSCFVLAPRAMSLLLLVLACSAAPSAHAAPWTPPRARVHASLQRELDGGGGDDTVLNVVIRLNEPPLSPLPLQPGVPRARAREAVALHLQQHRRDAQHAIRTLLSASSCDFFWITNRISCANITRTTLRSLLHHPDVSAIHPPSPMRRTRPWPSPTPSPPSSSPPGLQPNIHQARAPRPDLTPATINNPLSPSR